MPCRVSIRARPIDRAIPIAGRQKRSASMFQSAPDQLIGRYLGARVLRCRPNMFQSAPDQLIGRYMERLTRTALAQVFQSAPDQLIGRYVIRTLTDKQVLGFNPRPTN